MIILGLTGSIGMGKTETAGMFRRLEVPVYDADRMVHEIYQAGGPAVEPVGRAFPGVVKDGAVDRVALGKYVFNDEAALEKLEGIAHPLVRRRQDDFLARARAAGSPLVVLEIPLLLETGSDQHCDYVVVVSAPKDVQRRRVLSREGVSEERFEAILVRQMPDPEKRSRADFVIWTDKGRDAAFAEVERIVRDLLDKVDGEST